MSDEDRMRSEIARMQMRGDELTDQVRVLQFPYQTERYAADMLLVSTAYL